MKMSPTHFGELCDAVDNVLSAHSLQIIDKHRQTVAYAHCQFTAFCWSVLHASRYNTSTLYKAGLHDQHIETALKRILSDFA